MADISHTAQPRFKIDRVWLFAALLLLVAALF